MTPAPKVVVQREWTADIICLALPKVAKRPFVWIDDDIAPFIPKRTESPIAEPERVALAFESMRPSVARSTSAKQLKRHTRTSFTSERRPAHNNFEPEVVTTPPVQISTDRKVVNPLIRFCTRGSAVVTVIPIRASNTTTKGDLYTQVIPLNRAQWRRKRQNISILPWAGTPAKVLRGLHPNGVLTTVEQSLTQVIRDELLKHGRLFVKTQMRPFSRQLAMQLLNLILVTTALFRAGDGISRVALVASMVTTFTSLIYLFNDMKMLDDTTMEELEACVGRFVDEKVDLDPTPRPNATTEEIVDWVKKGVAAFVTLALGLYGFFGKGQNVVKLATYLKSMDNIGSVSTKASTWVEDILQKMFNLEYNVYADSLAKLAMRASKLAATPMIDVLSDLRIQHDLLSFEEDYMDTLKKFPKDHRGRYTAYTHAITIHMTNINEKKSTLNIVALNQDRPEPVGVILQGDKNVGKTESMKIMARLLAEKLGHENNGVYAINIEGVNKFFTPIGGQMTAVVDEFAQAGPESKFFPMFLQMFSTNPYELQGASLSTKQQPVKFRTLLMTTNLEHSLLNAQIPYPSVASKHAFFDRLIWITVRDPLAGDRIDNFTNTHRKPDASHLDLEYIPNYGMGPQVKQVPEHAVRINMDQLVESVAKRVQKNELAYYQRCMEKLAQTTLSSADIQARIDQLNDYKFKDHLVTPAFRTYMAAEKKKEQVPPVDSGVFRSNKKNVYQQQLPALSDIKKVKITSDVRPNGRLSGRKFFTIRFQGSTGTFKTTEATKLATSLSTNFLMDVVELSNTTQIQDELLYGNSTIPHIYLLDDMGGESANHELSAFMNWTHQNSIFLITSNYTPKRKFVGVEYWWLTFLVMLYNATFAKAFPSCPRVESYWQTPTWIGESESLQRRMGLEGPVGTAQQRSLTYNTELESTTLTFDNGITCQVGFGQTRIPKREIHPLVVAKYLRFVTSGVTLLRSSRPLPSIPAYDVDIVAPTFERFQDLLASKDALIRSRITGWKGCHVRLSDRVVPALSSNLNVSNFVIPRGGLSDIVETATTLSWLVRRALPDATIRIKAGDIGLDIQGSNVFFRGLPNDTLYNQVKITVEGIETIVSGRTFTLPSRGFAPWLGEYTPDLHQNNPELHQIIREYLLENQEELQKKFPEYMEILHNYNTQIAFAKRYATFSMTTVYTLLMVIMGILVTIFSAVWFFKWLYAQCVNPNSFATGASGEDDNPDSWKNRASRRTAQKMDSTSHVVKNEMTDDAYERTFTDLFKTGRNKTGGGDNLGDWALEPNSIDQLPKLDKRTTELESLVNQWKENLAIVRGNPGTTAHGFFIGGKTLLTVSHVRNFSDSTLTVSDDEGTYKATLLCDYPERDLSLWQVAIPGDKKSMIKWFPEDHASACDQDDAYYIRCEEGTTQQFSGVVQELDKWSGFYRGARQAKIAEWRPEQGILEWKMIDDVIARKHHHIFKSGDCGHIMVGSVDGKPRICGIHSALAETAGYFSSVSVDLLKTMFRNPNAIMNYKPNSITDEYVIPNVVHTIALVGMTEVTHDMGIGVFGFNPTLRNFNKGKTAFKQRLYHPDMTHKPKVSFAPQHWREIADPSNLPINPYTLQHDMILNQIVQYGDNSVPFAPKQELWELAVQAARSIYRAVYPRPRVLTLSEAINGVYNPRDPLSQVVGPMDLNKSAGPTAQHFGAMKKADLFSVTSLPGELRHVKFADTQAARIVKEGVIEKFKQGRAGVPVIGLTKACLKQELLPLEKCEAGKTRVFISTDTDITLLGRMLFAAHTGNEILHRDRGFCQLGMDPVLDFTRTFRGREGKLPEFICADAKRFDKNIHAPILDAWNDFMSDFVDAPHIPKEELKNLYRSYQTILLKSYCISDGLLSQFERGVLSGEVGTTSKDTWAVVLGTLYSLYRYCEENSIPRILWPTPEQLMDRSKFLLLGYGDDSMLWNDLIPEMKSDDYAQGFKDLGITIETIDKGNDGEEILFLGRRPIFFKDVVFPRLKESSLLRPLHFYRNPEDILENFNTILKSAALHPVSFFESVTTDIDLLITTLPPRFQTTIRNGLVRRTHRQWIGAWYQHIKNPTGLPELADQEPKIELMNVQRKPEIAAMTYVQKLNEYCQKSVTPVDMIIQYENTGPPHDRTFICKLHFLGDNFEGEGASKKTAKQDAHRNAWHLSKHLEGLRNRESLQVNSPQPNGAEPTESIQEMVDFIRNTFSAQPARDALEQQVLAQPNSTNDMPHLWKRPTQKEAKKLNALPGHKQALTWITNNCYNPDVQHDATVYDHQLATYFRKECVEHEAPMYEYLKYLDVKYNITEDIDMNLYRSTKLRNIVQALKNEREDPRPVPNSAPASAMSSNMGATLGTSTTGRNDSIATGVATHPMMSNTPSSAAAGGPASGEGNISTPHASTTLGPSTDLQPNMIASLDGNTMGIADPVGGRPLDFPEANVNLRNIMEAAYQPFDAVRILLTEAQTENTVLFKIPYGVSEFLSPWALLWILCHEEYFGDLCITFDSNAPPMMMGSILVGWAKDYDKIGATMSASDLQMVTWEEMKLSSAATWSLIIGDRRKGDFFRSVRDEDWKTNPRPCLVGIVYHRIQSQFPVASAPLTVSIRIRSQLAGPSISPNRPFSAFEPVSAALAAAASSALRGGGGAAGGSIINNKTFGQLVQSDGLPYLYTDGRARLVWDKPKGSTKWLRWEHINNEVGMIMDNEFYVPNQVGQCPYAISGVTDHARGLLLWEYDMAGYGIQKVTVKPPSVGVMIDNITKTGLIFENYGALYVWTSVQQPGDKFPPEFLWWNDGIGNVTHSVASPYIYFVAIMTSGIMCGIYSDLKNLPLHAAVCNGTVVNRFPPMPSCDKLTKTSKTETLGGNLHRLVLCGLAPTTVSDQLVLEPTSVTASAVTQLMMTECLFHELDNTNWLVFDLSRSIGGEIVATVVYDQNTRDFYIANDSTSQMYRYFNGDIPNLYCSNVRTQKRSDIIRPTDISSWASRHARPAMVDTELDEMRAMFRAQKLDNTTPHDSVSAKPNAMLAAAAPELLEGAEAAEWDGGSQWTSGSGWGGENPNLGYRASYDWGSGGTQQAMTKNMNWKSGIDSASKLMGPFGGLVKAISDPILAREDQKIKMKLAQMANERFNLARLSPATALATSQTYPSFPK